MLTKVWSSALSGITPFTVEVEVSNNARGNENYVSIVGLPDASVRESRERIRSAVYTSGLKFPEGASTVALAPADIKKSGAALDLPIALGLVGITNGIPKNIFDETLMIGELALDGRLRPVKGSLAMAIFAREQGFKRMLVPSENAFEASVAEGVEVFAVDNLRQAYDFLIGEESLSAVRCNLGSLFNQNQKYDESNRAREISDFLGTDHHEFKIQERDMLNIVPELQRIYDEPFADSSQIPSLLVNSLAKDFVKVCLSGDGGDELFGGYNRYVWSQRFQKIPSFTKNFISIFFNYFDPINLAFFYEKIENILPNRYKFNLPEEKFRKVQLAINSVNSIELYDKLTRTSQENNLLINNISFDNISAKWNELKNITNDITAMMALDFQTYLSDDILCKNDRASMYHSLEMRAPFLDKDIIKFAFNISDKFKINNGETKWISRQVLKKYLPVDKLSKTKTGFSIPIGSWLNNELKDWSEDLLDKKKIDKFEIFDSKKIINLWNDHKTGKANDNNQIWNIVMLQSWLEKNV